jgi:hypothetical protein
VCPGRGCSYRVYRDGGCRHITCKCIRTSQRSMRRS